MSEPIYDTSDMDKATDSYVAAIAKLTKENIALRVELQAARLSESINVNQRNDIIERMQAENERLAKAKDNFMEGVESMRKERTTLQRLYSKVVDENERLRLPLCIGQPIIDILANTGEYRCEHGGGLLAADDLFHNSPYAQVADLTAENERLTEQLRLCNVDQLQTEAQLAEVTRDYEAACHLAESTSKDWQLIKQQLAASVAKVVELENKLHVYQTVYGGEV